MEFFAHAEGIELDKGIKAKLDNLHLAKIQTADLVFIVDPGKYIGDSVRSEIDFASQLNKEIIFYSDYKELIK